MTAPAENLCEICFPDFALDAVPAHFLHLQLHIAIFHLDDATWDEDVPATHDGGMEVRHCVFV